MRSLASLAPDFVAEVADALGQRGFRHLAPQLQTAIIDRWAYDASLRSGYICLSAARPISNLVRPVDPIAHTVFSLGERGFNVDVGLDDRILGIELAGREDVVDSLQRTNAL